MRCYATETLTCVERYLGNVVKFNDRIFRYALYRDGTTEDMYAVVCWKDPAETLVLSDVLCVIVNGKRYYFEELEGWDDPVCRFPYDPDPYSTMLAKQKYADIITNGVLETDGIYFWMKEYTVLPQVTMNPVLYANHSQTLNWSLRPGDDRNGWGISLELLQKGAGEADFTSTVLFSEEQRSSWRLSTDMSILGRQAYLILEYRTYAADWDGKDLEDFVTLNRRITPVQTVTRNAAIPLAPSGVEHTMLLEGGKVTISWPAVKDPVNTISGYILERAAAAGGETPESFVRLYEGSSVQFRDTLPEGTDHIRYRVCAVNTAGTKSPWTDTGALAVVKSNLYMGVGGKWIRAAAVWIGSRKASPMIKIIGK